VAGCRVSQWNMDDGIAYQPTVAASMGGETEPEDPLIASIDAALAVTAGCDGQIRLADHVDVLLDLRLAATQTTRLRGLETEWATENPLPEDRPRAHSRV
jgi:hypothetical protein